MTIKKLLLLTLLSLTCVQQAPAMDPKQPTQQYRLELPTRGRVDTKNYYVKLDQLSHEIADMVITFTRRGGPLFACRRIITVIEEDGSFDKQMSQILQKTFEHYNQQLQGLEDPTKQLLSQLSQQGNLLLINAISTRAKSSCDNFFLFKCAKANFSEFFPKIVGRIFNRLFLLHAAIKNGDLASIKLILQKDINIILTDNEGKNALEYAEDMATNAADDDEKENMEKIIELIKEYGFENATKDGANDRIDFMKDLEIL